MLQKFFATLVRLAIPVLILAAGITAYRVLSHNPDSGPPPEPEERKIRTRVTELHVRDYTVQVTTQGVVLPHSEILLSTQVSGQVKTISPRLEAGAFFSEGEILVALDDREYVAAVKSAEAELLGAKSDLELAQVEHERAAGAYDNASLSLITKAEVDLAAASLSRARAALDAAAAQLEQTKLNLERTRITAPFDGRVREKLVGLGQYLNAGAPAAAIFAVDYAELRLPISTRDRRYLQLPEREGEQPVPVVLSDAINVESDVTWTASIVGIEGVLDSGSLELVAIARINDPFGLLSGAPPLRIGQPVTGTLQGEVLAGVVAIPRKAVRELDQVVLVDDVELTVRKATIQPIWSDEAFVIVRDPSLTEGVLLATTHIVYAPEGAKVEIIPEIDEGAATADRASLEAGT